MTLDTRTRANAESKHVQLKNSLALARHEFCSRFKEETELFRTLPLANASSGFSGSSGSATKLAALPLSPISHPHSHAQLGAVSSVPPPRLLGEDLVRTERLSQCCKRVRIWRRQTTNPLLSYKQQQLAKSQGFSSSTSYGASSSKTPLSSVGPSSASSSSSTATDHRMHLSLVMAMVVDMYEQKMAAEVGTTTVLLPQSTGSLTESFPEFVVKYIAARASSRRTAIDQVHSLVAMLLQPSTHARVRTFASLCGLVEDQYNPPEKLRAFLHMVESIHRLKVSASGAGTGAGAAAAAAAAAVAAASKSEDTTSLADVVFYNIGVSLTVAQRVVCELFEEEYYWNFRFWHSHFQELKLEYAWPAASKSELEDKIVALTAVTRNASLNAAKKIDGDALLELLLDTWTQRAKTLSDLLEAATDEEERKSVASLATKKAAQDARGHIAPLTEAEIEFFDELVDEFWNAEVPWSTSNKIQRQVSAICQGTRSLNEMASLYRKHVAELDESKKVWLWSQWPWDTDWEWGLIVVRDRDPLAANASSNTSTSSSIGVTTEEVKNS